MITTLIMSNCGFFNHVLRSRCIFYEALKLFWLSAIAFSNFGCLLSLELLIDNLYYWLSIS